MLKNQGVSRSKQETLLTDKQRRFASEYLIDYNSKQAAIRAGYSEKIAAATGCQLLKHPLVSKIIGHQETKLIKRLELSAEEILEQLYYMCTRSAADFCDENGKIITDVHKLSKRAQNTIDGIEQDIWYDGEGNQHVKTKLKLVPKTGAIDMAMKHKGLFAPTKVDNKVSLDWDSLHGKPPEEPDPVEMRLLEQEEQEK